MLKREPAIEWTTVMEKDGQIYKIVFIQDYCNKGERLGSTLNTVETAGNLHLRNRVAGERGWGGGVPGWKITKRTHQG